VNSVKLTHKSLYTAMWAPFMMVAAISSAEAAAPTFASSAKPAGDTSSSTVAPAPTLDSSYTSPQPSSSSNNTPPSTSPTFNQNNGDTNPGSTGAGSGKSARVQGPAAVPQKTLSDQALRQNIVRNANTSSDTDNSVQSFFQCAPVNVTSKEIERRQTSEDKKTAGEFSLKKLIYHSLDNIGVPMFTGRTDSELAPGISRAYVDPPAPSLTKHGSAKEIQQLFSQEGAVAGGKPSQTPKIPLSELEGTSFETVPNATAEIHTALPDTHAKTN
jgi:hypothetical protein